MEQRTAPEFSCVSCVLSSITLAWNITGCIARITHERSHEQQIAAASSPGGKRRHPCWNGHDRLGRNNGRTPPLHQQRNACHMGGNAVVAGRQRAGNRERTPRGISPCHSGAGSAILTANAATRFAAVVLRSQLWQTPSIRITLGEIMGRYAVWNLPRWNNLGHGWALRKPPAMWITCIVGPHPAA